MFLRHILFLFLAIVALFGFSQTTPKYIITLNNGESPIYCDSFVIREYPRKIVECYYWKEKYGVGSIMVKSIALNPAYVKEHPNYREALRWANGK
jgi:hypothetical protein